MNKPFFSESDCDLPPNIKFEDQSCYAKWFPGEKYLSLKKANRLIQERAKVVYGVYVSSENGGDEMHMSDKPNPDFDDYQALLICVEEIAKDSAEKVLVDLIKVMSEATCWSEPFETLKNRAKRLLEGK